MLNVIRTQVKLKQNTRKGKFVSYLVEALLKRRHVTFSQLTEGLPVKTSDSPMSLNGYFLQLPSPPNNLIYKIF